jgi:isoquinoline 1-oxidoreductase
VRLAAERTGDDPGTLVAAAGAIRDRSGDRPIEYGELLRDMRRVETIDGADLGEDASLGGVVGDEARPPTRRLSGPAIVTGTHRYPTDLWLPDMLHGCVLRQPSAGARLRSIDTQAASDLPGVTIIRDGDFVGVVAANPSAAENGLAHVAAEWDRPEWPSEDRLVDWLRAHPVERVDGWRAEQHPVEQEGWGGPFRHETGNLDAAIERAPTYLAATYTTAYIAHVPLETHSALASWGDDGRVTVWMGTQAPFSVRSGLAEALELDEAMVRVIVPDAGGGFGGKHAAGVGIEAAKLARATGRPVKVRWTRHEEFTEGHLRPAAVIDVTSGADRTAIAAWGLRNTNAGMAGLFGPYRIPNERLEFLPTEPVFRQGAYRGVAATANHFARESHMDELAHALDADPLTLRLAHLDDERLVAVLRVATDRIGWGEPRAPGHGVGLACAVEKGARVATAVEIAVGEDRRPAILRVVTALECGAIVNPDGLANQVEGAVVMGLGGALFEAVRFESGVIRNGTFTDYRVPRIDDVPPMEVILLDRRDLPSAGAGETPILAIAPAIANAIFDATGVRLRSLPLIPDGFVPG